jgi:hypothetical protein
MRSLASWALLLSAAIACGEPTSSEPVACDAAWRAFDAARDGDYATYAASLGRTRCPKPWTVLIYMAADVEDLPAQAFADLREMEDAQLHGGPAAASSARADVIVQLDLPDPPGLRRYHLFSRTGLAHAAAAPSSPEVARAPEEVDAPPEAALAEFIAWGRANYPSEHLLVVLWGHAQGWRPRTLPAGPVHYSDDGFVGGFGFDHSQGTVMDVPALAEALQRGTGGAPIDVLISDACLMQNVDVAGALARSARHLVGHEQIDPYVGLPYEHVIPLVNGQQPAPARPECAAEDEACRVAASLPGLLVAPEAGDTFVASAVSAEVLTTQLLPALQGLSTALVAFFAEDPLRASDVQARLSSRTPGEGLPGFAGNTVDLGVLLARLRQEAQEEGLRCAPPCLQGSEGACAPPCPGVRGLLAALDDAERTLDGAVITVAFGPAYAEDDAYAWTSGPAGLSVWLPPRAEVLAARRADFLSSPASGWLPWLDHLYPAP